MSSVDEKEHFFEDAQVEIDDVYLSSSRFDHVDAEHCFEYGTSGRQKPAVSWKRPISSEFKIDVGEEFVGYWWPKLARFPPIDQFMIPIIDCFDQFYFDFPQIIRIQVL